jgi:protein-S-isoprenylcysteine O-methyltransferase Ste14
VFEGVKTAGHPTSEKAFPARELECVQCYMCEAKCPVQAIRTIYPGLTGWQNVLAWLFFPLLVLQLIGGNLYGIWFGPLLGLQALFLVGWGVLVFGVLFLLSSLMAFRKQGEPIEGRGIMATTVLVESGTDRLVHHPQSHGMILMVCAPMFVSHHWLFALIGVPLIVPMFTTWIPDSEKHLIAKFGEDYKRYMEKVPRVNLILGIIRLLRRKWEKVNH